MRREEVLRTGTSRELDFPIPGSGPLSRFVRELGYPRFAEVAGAVRALPYGRVQSEDTTAVLKERRGTSRCAGRRYDFTGLPARAASPLESLIEEHVVSPEDLPAFKVAYHRRALAQWARRRGMDPERAWTIRERCIAALAGHAPA
jgi:hypothetical protein